MPLTQHGITRRPDTQAPPASKFTHGLETLSGEATTSVHSLFFRVSMTLSRKGSPGSSDRRFDELKTFTAPSNALRNTTSIAFAMASSLWMWLINTVGLF
jgi:hypothetical protein